MQKMKKILEKIGNLFLNILLLLITIIIILGLYYFFQITIQKKSYANLFGYTIFEVATGSMENTIEIGDLIIVEVTNDVKENDIIVYKENENFITHRLIEKKEGVLIAKGDANNSLDQPISIDQVLGKVIEIIPKVGIWKKVLLSPEILSGIIIFVILIGIILNIKNKTEEDNEKKIEK